MKRKLIIASILVVILATLTTGTLAYYSSKTVAHNVITSGNVKIELVEKTQSGDTLVDFPKEGITGIMPGTDVSKIVTVENRGFGTAWIRVRIDSEITGADGSLPAKITVGKETIDVMSFAIGEDWVEKDGYYYYKNPVPAAAATTALLEEVHFAAQMGNEYQNCTANLIVSAQAVQTANNGTTVLEAKGWPAEEQE